jgi:hypothetical protein
MVLAVLVVLPPVVLPPVVLSCAKAADANATIMAKDKVDILTLFDLFSFIVFSLSQ